MLGLFLSLFSFWFNGLRLDRLDLELLQRRRVNERSWLLFFDPELADEWMGIYEGAPPPPARPPSQ